MMSLLLSGISCIGRTAVSRALLGFVLLPCLAASAQTTTQAPSTLPAAPEQANPQPPTPDQPVLPAGHCPIRVDEAFLTTEPAASPAEGSAARRTLHVTLVDASGKRIVSYAVHAKIALRPDGPFTNAFQAGRITRRWHGQLDPDTPTKQQWTFPAARFSTSLQRVWFDQVTFADGAVWNKSPNDGCSFAATGRIVQTRTGAKGH